MSKKLVAEFMGTFTLIFIGAGSIMNGKVDLLGVAFAHGLAIAIIALFAFNYFSRQQNYTIDEMERLANKLIYHIKIDRKITD